MCGNNSNQTLLFQRRCGGNGEGSSDTLSHSGSSNGGGGVDTSYYNDSEAEVDEDEENEVERNEDECGESTPPLEKRVKIHKILEINESNCAKSSASPTHDSTNSQSVSTKTLPSVASDENRDVTVPSNANAINAHSSIQRTTSNSGSFVRGGFNGMFPPFGGILPINNHHTFATEAVNRLPPPQFPLFGAGFINGKNPHLLKAQFEFASLMQNGLAPTTIAPFIPQPILNLNNTARSGRMDPSSFLANQLMAAGRNLQGSSAIFPPTANSVAANAKVSPTELFAVQNLFLQQQLQYRQQLIHAKEHERSLQFAQHLSQLPDQCRVNSDFNISLSQEEQSLSPQLDVLANSPSSSMTIIKESTDADDQKEISTRNGLNKSASECTSPTNGNETDPYESATKRKNSANLNFTNVKEIPIQANTDRRKIAKRLGGFDVNSILR